MSSLDLSTAVGSVILSNPLYNASGARCRSLEELKKLEKSLSSMVLSKSATKNFDFLGYLNYLKKRVDNM